MQLLLTLGQLLILGVSVGWAQIHGGSTTTADDTSPMPAVTAGGESEQDVSPITIAAITFPASPDLDLSDVTTPPAILTDDVELTTAEASPEGATEEPTSAGRAEGVVEGAVTSSTPIHSDIQSSSGGESREVTRSTLRVVEPEIESDGSYNISSDNPDIQTSSSPAAVNLETTTLVQEDSDHPAGDTSPTPPPSPGDPDSLTSQSHPSDVIAAPTPEASDISSSAPPSEPPASATATTVPITSTTAASPGEGGDGGSDASSRESEDSSSDDSSSSTGGGDGEDTDANKLATTTATQQGSTNSSIHSTTPAPATEPPAIADSATATNVTEPPSTGGNVTEPPSTGGNVTEPPSTGGNVTEPPSNGGNVTEPPSNGGNVTEPPSTGGNVTELPTTTATNSTPQGQDDTPATEESIGVCFGEAEVNTVVVVAVVVAVNVLAVVVTALCVHRIVSRRLTWDPPPIYYRRSVRREEGKQSRRVHSRE